MPVPSCRRAVLLSNVMVDSRTGKQELAPHAAGEREFIAVPVKVIPAHVQAAGGFRDGEQLIGPGGERLGGGIEAGQSGISDFLDFPQEAR